MAHNINQRHYHAAYAKWCLKCIDRNNAWERFWGFLSAVGAILAILPSLPASSVLSNVSGTCENYAGKERQMKRKVSKILICVAITILCTLGCEELRDGIKSNPGDDTGNSIISISKDDVSPNNVNTGRVVITDADGNWGH